MTEMNEAEVLAEVALETWRGGPSFEVAADMCNRIAVAVAAKARELDAARGGTLSAEDVARHVAQVRACGAEVSCGILSGHLFAQGRTIAAKDARIAELRAMLASTESALATLRQAVDDAVRAIIRGEFGRAETILNATKDATPSEHPDTAMLREVTAEHDALKQAAAPYLTHDGESWVAHVDPDPAATLRDIRKQSLVDMALKGTVPTQRNGWPTTPPDAAAREQERYARELREMIYTGVFPTPPDVAASEAPCPHGTCPHPAGDHGVDNPGGTRLALVCCRDCPCGWATKPGDVFAEGPGVRMTDAGNGYVRVETTTPTPTHEEDWRTAGVPEPWVLEVDGVKVDADGDWVQDGRHTDVVAVSKALAKELARLKDAPRRAAERMRERADVAVLMLQPPASLLKQCETSAEANAVRGAWCAAINAAVDAIRALEVTP